MTDWLSYLLYLGYPICKQFPERSYLYQSYQMPMEARDVGIFVGFLVTLVFIYFMRLRLVMGKGSLHVLVTSSLLLVPLMIDAGSSYVGIRGTTNDIRLMTGLMFGVGAGVLIFGWDRGVSIPSNRPIEMKHMPFALVVLPLHPLIAYSSTGTLAGFVLFSLLSVIGYVVLFFIALRLLLVESDIDFFEKRKGTFQIELFAIAFEALLFGALGVAHYMGALLL
jgi:uncharacterized membrane protein